MLEAMKQLVRERNICVLATSTGERPYCSLMAYAANDTGTEIYLATHRATRKFKNLAANPTVSLLIDTREDDARPQIRALTVEGRCLPVTDETRREHIRKRLLALHPQLEAFLAHDDCAILCVTITAFLLLNGLTEAHYAVLE